MQIERLTATLVTVLLGMLVATSCADQPAPKSDAEALLDASIAFHDPDGLFMERTHRLILAETRASGRNRRTTITFDGPGMGLEMEQHRDDHLIQARINPDGCQASLNGSTAIPDSLAERYRLTCEGLGWVRDYYAFLYALPMKLRMPGTNIDPAVTDTTFQEEPVRSIRATFDAEVGTDTWFLYFDPATSELVGYRFFHGDDPTSGEYIVLDGEFEADGMRLPRERHWYFNADDRFLGTDTIEGYESIP